MKEHKSGISEREQKNSNSMSIEKEDNSKQVVKGNTMPVDGSYQNDAGVRSTFRNRSKLNSIFEAK